MWDVVNLSARINEWHHVAIVYDGDECHFYLDGVQTAAQKDTGDIAVRPTDVFIGMPGTGTDHEDFVGLIDGKCAFSAADVCGDDMGRAVDRGEAVLPRAWGG